MINNNIKNIIAKVIKKQSDADKEDSYYTPIVHNLESKNQISLFLSKIRNKEILDIIDIYILPNGNFRIVVLNSSKKLVLGLHFKGLNKVNYVLLSSENKFTYGLINNRRAFNLLINTIHSLHNI